MQQQRLFFIQSAISTMLMIIAVGVVICKADDKKKVDFVFVVELSPLFWESHPLAVDRIYQVVFGDMKRWINLLLVCMEQDRWVNDNVNAGYSGFIYDMQEDKLEEPTPFTYSIKKMRDSYVKMIYTVRKETKPDPNRREKTEAAVKKVRDAIRRPAERQGVPVILLWHVPHPWGMDELVAIQHLMKAKNGPEAVFAFHGWDPMGRDFDGIPSVTDCIYCDLQGIFKDFPPSAKCNHMQPYINAIFNPFSKCKTVATYSKCYYNGMRHCVVDVAYGPEKGTEEKYLKYCWTAGSKGVENCKDGKQACESLCDDLMIKSACSVTCGQGTMKVERPSKPDQFTENCPERVLPCDEPPCPGQTPATRRRVTTTTTTTQTITTAGSVSTFSRTPAATPTSTTSVPGGILKPWMIAVMAVCAVALLAIIIGVIVCCACKGEKSPAPGASYWSRFYTRRSAPRRHHVVARSPARTHGRQSPRYHSRPRSPSPAHHHRPHAPSRPVHASMAPTAHSGQPQRHRY